MATTARTPDRTQGALLIALFQWLVYVTHGIDRTVMYVLLQPISREFGLFNTEIGLVAGAAYIVPYAIAGIPIGALGDRLSRTRLLALLIAVWSVATLAASLATGLGGLILARAAVGAAEGGAPAIMLALVADAVPAQRRAPLVGLLMTGPFIGLLIGSLAGGAVAGQLGWRPALWVAGAPGLLLALLIATILREPERGRFDTGPAEAPPSPRQAVKLLTDDRTRLLIFGALAISAVAPLALGAWMPIYLMRGFHVSIASAGREIGLALGLLGALGTLAGGAIAARSAEFDSRRLLLSAAAAVAIAIPAGIVALVATAVMPAVIALGIWAFVASLYIAPSYSAFIATVPIRARSTLVAAIAVSANLIGAAGPQLVGWASDRLPAATPANGLRYALLLCLVALPLQALALFAAARRQDG